MHDLDLTALTAIQIAARVRDGRNCAVEVARAHLSRVAARDPDVGVFRVHDAQRVLAEAGGVDSRADRFALPLAGVPVVVTDDIDVAGYPTRRGSTATAADPARRDDELVKRLRAAGAVIVGKTRMPELGAFQFLDPTGGAAAAVAAGMAALAVGTDGGGAIRVPAAYCGLVGLKAGNGMLPLPGGAAESWHGLAATGALARTADDAALLFGALAGHPLDLASAPGPTRIVLSLRHPFRFGRLAADHRAAAIGAAARLHAGPGGATVTLAEPPYPRGLATRWLRRWQAGIAQDAAGLALQELEPRTAAVVGKGQRVLRFTRPGSRAPADWRDRMISWLDEGGYDLLLGPAVAGAAAVSGPTAGHGYRRTLLGAAARVPFSHAWNLAGLPAVVAPVLVNGRPAGVQLVGRPGSEAVLLAAAARMEHRVVPATEPATPRVYA